MIRADADNPRHIRTERGTRLANWTEVTPLDKVQQWLDYVNGTALESIADALQEHIETHGMALKGTPHHKERMRLSNQVERIKDAAEKAVFGKVLH